MVIFFCPPLFSIKMRKDLQANQITNFSFGWFEIDLYVNGKLVIRKDPTQFQCDLCQKHLKTEDSLKKHVQFTCLQDRPESCPICFKNFICKKSVKLHVQSVHLKEKPNICDECGKGFCTPTSLRTHRENVHEKLKKYVCHLCNKAYGNQGNLYVHNQRHHQRYSYCCESCGKQFCRPFELRYAI